MKIPFFSYVSSVVISGLKLKVDDTLEATRLKKRKIASFHSPGRIMNTYLYKSL